MSRVATKYTFPALVFFLCFLFVSTTAYAQLGSPSPGAALLISPRYPEPQMVVSVSLNAPSFSGENIGVRWFVDGVEEIAARDQRSFELVAGELGSSQTVRAQIINNGIVVLGLAKTIRPSLVDIILEPDTIVPSFYKGKPLLSPGSSFTAIAVPHTQGGSIRNYSYEWELDGRVVSGGSLRGGQSVSLTMPQLSSPLLSVIVRDTNGTIVAQKGLRLSGQTPEVHFYEVSPLRGKERVALPQTLQFPGDEMSIVAEAYFVDKNIFADTWEYAWRLNGEQIENTNTDPAMLTLQKTGALDPVAVSFQAINTKSLFQVVSGSFNLLFE